MTLRHRSPMLGPARALFPFACAFLTLLFAVEAPSHTQSDPEPLAGRFLVATEKMVDPRFRETVIFMARHSRRGAMGIVVNQPFAVGSLGALANTMGITARDPDREVVLHHGGPVRPTQGSLLHSPDYSDAESLAVTSWVSLSQSRDAFKALVNGEGPETWLMALGYAGWSPGQLERELLTDSWFVIDADPGLLFETPAEERWQRAVALRGIDL